MLHRLALIQQVPSAADDEVDADDLRRLASTFAADEIQLFYQIALHGRNEMHLAPDEYAGFTMALMRMLAFAPIEAASARRRRGLLLPLLRHARALRRRSKRCRRSPRRNRRQVCNQMQPHLSMVTGLAWSRD